ncbi:hypothetical protein A9O66_36840 (plasmid) [Paraburkholderia caribensis]|uniref:Uncharacterized protein n=1 Tax=Paraburkholderia caribensis TaxID=75105 RepID=A0A9Q6SBS3_9BURK|nr:hypothetical protein A9O66_36840 [Paraburkholderia caribensis]
MILEPPRVDLRQQTNPFHEPYTLLSGRQRPGIYRIHIGKIHIQANTQTYTPINRTDGKRIKSQWVVKALLRDHERRYTDQPMSRNT